MGMEIVFAKDGVLRNGPVTNIAAPGAANAAAVWTLSAAAQRVGVTSVRLKHLRVRANAIGANVFFQLGTGVGGGYADLVPPMMLIDNFENDFDLHDVEAFATVTGFPAVLPAGSVDVQLTVEERS